MADSMTPKDELAEFERELDLSIQALPILSLPQRVLLVGVHSSITSLFMGGDLGREGHPQPEKAVAIINRMSYVVDLLRKGPAEPFGENAMDALSPFEESGAISQLLMLVQYGHFSEIMPELHRNYYSVSGSKEKGFVLEHPSSEFAAAEEMDILLSEISTPFFKEPSFDRRADFIRVARMLTNPAKQKKVFNETLLFFTQGALRILSEECVRVAHIVRCGVSGSAGRYSGRI